MSKSQPDPHHVPLLFSSRPIYVYAVRSSISDYVTVFTELRLAKLDATGATFNQVLNPPPYEWENCVTDMEGVETWTLRYKLADLAEAYITITKYRLNRFFP